MPPALAIYTRSAEDTAAAPFDKCFIVRTVSVFTFFSLPPPPPLHPPCTPVSVFIEQQSLFTDCCFSVSQAFDVCLNCCSLGLHGPRSQAAFINLQVRAVS